ncbi:MAG: ion channel [Porticoccaceae bacterium]
MPLIRQDQSYSAMLGEFICFSYVTQSTLGYGDVLPVSPIARSWATVEAIMGQLYLAIVVARLLGIYISKESEELR